MSRIAIIGSGLGGLECAFILAKNGHEVTVLEQNARVGGCMQSFRREGITFDTGMHYVGGLGEGESLEWLFRYFGLTGLPWSRLSEECTDKIYLKEQSYDIPSGYERYVSSLGARFPGQEKGIREYARHIMEILSCNRSRLGNSDKMGLFGASAYDFLHEHIGDTVLAEVISGASMRLLKSPETLSLYEFAQINGSFMQSAWRLKGGGWQIAESLAESVRKFGGNIRTGCKIVSLRENDGKVGFAETDDGEKIVADIFISDIHPAAALSLIEGNIRKSYTSRIHSLKNSPGVFTVNIKLKPGKVKYRNFNLHIHSGKRYVMASFYAPPEGNHAEALDILTPVSAQCFEGRNEDYEERKASLASEYINLACEAVPELKESIDKFWTSSPLTYSDFISSPDGSAFGIIKDCRDPLATVLSPKTPLSNLFLTGQNINLHGALGVSMTSLYTCAAIIGNDKINEEFNLI